uniref:NLP/P60 family protein n=1 Tax=uncultured Thiotrichaceae bacterium TaxID=298394 RepID=A0A6S6U290_9GAMM|nr:MAG: NLP/P60 family protein [uncultured Thiotrichaceae bacterium]
MFSIPKRIVLVSTLTALGSFSFASKAGAQYEQYNGYSQQQVSYQRASYQAPTYWNNTNANPPEILPYVPFNNEPVAGANLFQPPPQNVGRINQPPVQYYQPASRSTPNTPHLSAERQRVIAAAKRQMGIKYRWGGNTPGEGFDCSGFTKYSLKVTGAKIPRTAAQQSKASRTIKRSSLRPGDMIFFKTSGKRVNHVGIYLGNGKFIHAASGGGKVMTDDLRKNYWQKRLYKYGTFLS